MKKMELPIPQKFSDPVVEAGELVNRVFGISRALIILPTLASIVLLILLFAVLTGVALGMFKPPSIVTTSTSAECGPIRGLIQQGQDSDGLTEEILRRELEWFVRNIRQVTSDKTANEQAVVSAGSHILDGQPYVYVNKWYDSSEGPPARQGSKQRVYIDKVTTLHLRENTYLVTWNERAEDDSGFVIDETPIQATITIKHIPLSQLSLTIDKKRELEIHNPLGWFIGEIDWQRSSRERRHE